MPTTSKKDVENDDPLLEMEADLILLEEQFEICSPLYSTKEIIEAEEALNEFKDNLLRVRGLIPWPITCNTDTTLS